jgi:hypothetical protein
MTYTFGHILLMIVDAEFDVYSNINIVGDFGDLPATSNGCSWKYAVPKCNDLTISINHLLAPQRMLLMIWQAVQTLRFLSSETRLLGSQPISAVTVHPLIFPIFGIMRTQTTKRVRDSMCNAFRCNSTM